MEYEIKGGNYPIVICKLNKGESLKTESGGMALMSPHVKMETNTDGGILKGLGRALSGDTIFLTHYIAEENNQEVGFGSAFPGKIIPIELDGSQTIIAQKNAFLVAEESVEFKTIFRKKLGAGLFGGEGFILQKFQGEGLVFLEIDGEVLEYTLEPGEKMLIDQGHLAAMDETVDFDIQRVKGAKNMLLGGEGLFLGTLTGPGRVWIQTMPLSRFMEAILPHIPRD
ncbi:MAG: TIGR00266 family protein [archaeon]|nr:TIGR00266 family protein [archaeon]